MKKFEHSARKGTFTELGTNNRTAHAEFLREAWNKLENFERRTTTHRGQHSLGCSRADTLPAMMQDLLDNPDKTHRIDGADFQSDSVASATDNQPVDLTRLITRWNTCLQALAAAVASQVTAAESEGASA